MMRRVRLRGFTLVELMTVVVIIGVMAALTMVSVQKGKAEGQLDTFANQIRNLMVQARRRSVGTGTTYLIDLQATAVQLCQIDPNNPGQINCPTPINAACNGAPPVAGTCENSRLFAAGPEATASLFSPAVDLGQGVGRSAISPSHKQVYFYRDGTADSMPGSVARGRPTIEQGATVYLQGVTNPLKHRKIIVYATSGRPRIIDQWQ